MTNYIWNRLLQYVQVELNDLNKCWLWPGYKSRHGYGLMRAKGKLTSVHRLMWKMAFGDIPEGICVCHKCDVRNCIAPHHLFLGTQQDNANDMISKGRSARGQEHGSYKHPERWARGENSGKSKLTEKQVLEIRKLEKHASYCAIAKKFSIDPSTVSDIIKRKIWKHL